MSGALVLPAALALALVHASSLARRRLPPAAAARWLAAVAVAAAAAVGGALAAIVVGFAAQVPGIAGRLGWCRSLARSHEAVPAWLGVGAAAALAAMAVSVARCWRRRRRAVSQLRGLGAVEVVASTDPVAYAVPGRPGHVVVSDGMLALLDPTEQRALFAHERSHLANRHHRYTAWAELAAAGLPLLGRLAAQVRFATERWADEDAAAEVGDRRAVARAIARAALAGPRVGGGPVLALGRDGVAARVQALLVEPVPAPLAGAAAVALLPALSTAASSTLQLHHLVTFAAHVCGL